MPIMQSYATGGIGPGDEGTGAPGGRKTPSSGWTPSVDDPLPPPQDTIVSPDLIGMTPEEMVGAGYAQEGWMGIGGGIGGGIGSRYPIIGGGEGQDNVVEEEQWVDPGMGEYSEYSDQYGQYTDYNTGLQYASLLDHLYYGGENTTGYDDLEGFYKDLAYNLNPDLELDTWNEVWENQESLFSSIDYHKPELYNMNRKSEAQYNNLMNRFMIDNYDPNRKKGQSGMTMGSGLYQDIGREKTLKDYELGAKKIDHDLQLKEHGFYSDIGSSIWDLLATFTDLGGYDPSLDENTGGA